VIASLTGLRAVCALWVELFHYRSEVLTLLPGLRPVRPLLDTGYLGVDVFFVLSGFVLAYNYSDALASWRGDRARRFVQNRVARVWPVHLVTLHLDLLLAVAIGTLGVTEGGHRRTLGAYAQNLSMTHAWWNDRPSFNAPAWSISAEWAAYLACPLLLIVLARLRSAWLAALGVLTLYGAMLTVFALWAQPNGNVAHAGMLRLSVEFCAGLLMLRIYQRRPALLGRLALPVAAALVIVIFAVPATHVGYWLAPLLGVLVLCLATDDGPLARLLSTPVLLFWGEASYCLYMTHVLAQPVLHLGVEPADVADASVLVRLAVLSGYLLVLGGLAVTLHRWVEVPARQLLRARRPTPAPAPSGAAERELTSA
jgi:peptidoglycan/LPS O-acetylase OafA/YrhL